MSVLVWPSGLLNIGDIITYGWATHNKDAHLITRARSYGGQILFVGQERPWRRSRLDMASSLRVSSLHKPKAAWELTVISLDTFRHGNCRGIFQILDWFLSRGKISGGLDYTGHFRQALCTRNYTSVHLRSIFIFRKRMSTSMYDFFSQWDVPG